MSHRFRHITNPLRLRKWLLRHQQSEYLLTLFYAILIGVAAGLLGAFFHSLMQLIQTLFFGVGEEGFSSLTAMQVLAVPVLGGVLMALMQLLAPETASRKGVVEVMKSLKLSDGMIKPATTLFHFLAPAINIGTGGSVGPEGPAVQFGAGISSWIGQFFHVSPARMKVMVAAGAGAAISAIFNAPLGGVFFTLEIILLNDLKDVTFGVLILASVVANVVSRGLVGAHDLFHMPELQAATAAELPWFLVLGILGGLVSVGFSRWSSLLARLIWIRLRSWPRWIFPPLSGLLLGLFALQYPQVLGIGYHSINEVLGGELLWGTAAILLLLKLGLTALNIELGGFGGIIAPSLFIGAMLGATLGGAAAGLPSLPATGLLIVAGMGTVLAGMNGIPLTAFLLLIEMTGNYDLVLPMMVSVAAATLVIQLVVGERSLYLYKLRKARLLDEGDTSLQIHDRRVSELMQELRPVVAATSLLQTILPDFSRHDLKDLIVLDEQERVTGMVDFADLRFIIDRPEALQIIRTVEISAAVPHVGPDSTWAEALEAFEGLVHDYLPIQDEEGKILGILFRSTLTKELNSLLRDQHLKGRQDQWAFK